jgi:DNA (cytosine-5)-methyltransferase 1
MTAMTFGSLFSGIGGMDLGLERAGMVCRWQVEIDDHCRRVLGCHWPEVKRYADIREVTGDELERVDVICGGFPCQPTSTAGKRLGSADPRWLWPEMARLLGVLRPRYAVLENTPGLLERGMGDVLRDLALLGLDAEWDCLPAAAFGAPHLRYRLFIVAYPAIDTRNLAEGSRRERQGAADAPRNGADGTAADADGERRARRIKQSERLQGSAGAARAGAASADALRTGHEGQPGSTMEAVLPAESAGEARNFASLGREARRPVFPEASAEYPATLRTDHWQADSRFRRVVHGLSRAVDRVTRRRENLRIERLGNAVVPACAEWIGRRIVEADAQRRAEP